MASGEGDEVKAKRVLRLADVAQESLEFLQPIGGYAKLPLVPLEEAVEPLLSILPDIQSYAYVAKQKCKKPADDLTQDESASIMLYTMGWDPLDECLYYVLNDTLRAKDRQQKLKVWYLYLRLFLNALFRLPEIPITAYRGVKLNLSKRYLRGETIVWWGFSSCTTSIGVLENDLFMGQTDNRTMFTLQCKSARDIRKHSFYEIEDEVLLLAATQFKVISTLNQGNLHIIQLEETTPPAPLLQPIPLTGSLPSSSNPSVAKPTKVSSVTEKISISTSTSQVLPSIPTNARWKRNGTTVAGGNRQGNAINQLYGPLGLFVDDDQTVVIADHDNDRIIQWKKGDINGQVVAGGNGQGNRLDQLNCPSDVLFNNETDTLIIADQSNRRVVQYPRRHSTKPGEILIDDIDCWGLAMDNEGYFYISNYKRHEVRRYQVGVKKGTLVAGGKGQGDNLNQLNCPKYIFVDRQQNIYVSDSNNHRVIKWNKGAKEGIVVAGNQGRGNSLTQLYYPSGIFVDTLSTLYVADSRNHRVIRWVEGDKEGSVIAGGNGEGAEVNQLNSPSGLFFDRRGNLYVADQWNYRVQRFSIE